jgi:glutathione S-transferase
MLEEVGVEVELIGVPPATSEDGAPPRAAPTLVDGAAEIVESSAIVMHLADRFPEKQLAPPLGSAERAHYYRWIAYVAATVDGALDDLALHTRTLPPGGRVPAIAERAKRTLTGAIRLLERALDGRRHLVGDAFTAADVVVGSAVVALDLHGVLARSPILAAYHEGLLGRRAYQRIRAAMQDPGGGAQPWATSVCLRAGRGVPVFLGARPNQTVGSYAALLGHLQTERPIHLLQFQYPEEEQIGRPYGRPEFAAWARVYREAMRDVQPAGPYLFVGICEGGQIGYEIVKLLEAEGAPIGLFAAIDTWPEENTRAPFLTAVHAVQTRAGRFLGLPAEQQVRRVTRKVTGVLGRALGRKPARAPETTEAWRERVFPKEVFVPRPVKTRIIVFRAAKQPYWRIRDPELGWGSRTTGGVVVYPIDGEHRTILREPFVASFGRQLSICLGRVEIDRGT